MAPTLGYWDIRGTAEQSRLLMHYLGIQFEERRYKCGPPPDFDKSDWFSKKYTLDLDFPNLPFYIDGNFKLTQSNAIIEYIADKNGMIPECKKLRAELHMLQNEIFDCRVKFAMLCYNPNFEKLKASELEVVHQKLNAFEEYLGDKQWLTGDKINYPDFNLCELLNQLEKFDPKFLDMHPKLHAYLKCFENLPQLKSYMSSEKFKTLPCNNRMAQWGGDK